MAKPPNHKDASEMCEQILDIRSADFWSWTENLARCYRDSVERTERLEEILEADRNELARLRKQLGKIDYLLYDPEGEPPLLGPAQTLEAIRGIVRPWESEDKKEGDKDDPKQT